MPFLGCVCVLYVRILLSLSVNPCCFSSLYTCTSSSADVRKSRTPLPAVQFHAGKRACPFLPPFLPSSLPPFLPPLACSHFFHQSLLTPYRPVPLLLPFLLRHVLYQFVFHARLVVLLVHLVGGRRSGGDPVWVPRGGKGGMKG